MQGQPTRAPHLAERAPRAQTLEQRLERKLAAARKYEVRIRRLEAQRRLLSSDPQRARVEVSRRNARQRLRQLETTVATLRRAIRTRNARRAVPTSPRDAICDTFGRYCDEAVAVAWCESRLLVTAQNGQYLGLFQMGSYERRLFGHGSTAHAQAQAAHKYFVQSGRDWSPWSCRWAAQ